MDFIIFLSLLIMGGKIAIDSFIIAKVKEIRQLKNITQLQLSTKLGYSEGFIGNIENPNRSEKYNVRHLNEIAKILGCSPKDFWPEEPI